MKTIKEKVKAVIFDMDGTIIQTEHIWDNATRGVLKKRGFETLNSVQQEAFDALSGMGMRQAWKLLKNVFKITESLDCLAKETLDHATLSFKQGVEFIKGFEHFHQTLRNHNIPSAIATNASLEMLSMLSTVMNFQRFFGQNLYSLSHVDNKAKPDPAIFLHTAEKLAVKPQDCVVFEDSYYGFQAASAAGMKCIAIEHPKNHAHRHHAHHSIPDYHHAQDALRKIIETKKA